MAGATYFSMNRENKSPISSLKFLTGPLAGNSYPITKAITSLGRETSNDIVISDPTVSRYHAHIIWENGSWTIKKLVTHNTLTVNQHALSQSSLNNRDTIALGSGTTFLFLITHNPLPNTPPPANIAPSTPIREIPPYNVSNAAYNPQSKQNSLHPPVNQSPVIIPSTPIRPQPSALVEQNPPAHLAQSDLQQKDHTVTLHADSEFANQINCPWLEVSTNTDQDKQIYPLTPDCQVFDIGRDRANTIMISRPTVSGFHAQIIREGNQLVLIHPHPSRARTLNGLIYQGMTIRGNEQFRHALSRGDIFRISDDNGSFVTLTYNDGSGMAQEVLPEIHPIPLGALVIPIGRAADNAVILNHPQVSGHHARLEQVRGGYRIIDMNSTNHIYVNAQRTQT